MKVGINGAVHDFSDMRVGINGAVRQASELWIGVNGAAKKVWPTFPVGGTVVIDTVGRSDWVCPVSGRWQVEMHGGGGGPAGRGQGGSGYVPRGAGGGSGNVSTFTLIAGENYAIVIGKGGTPGTDAINWTPATNGEDGEATQFVGEMNGKVGTTNCPGGGGGDTENNRGGAASGNLATAGASYNGQLFLAGGLGNKNKPKRKYGNGGDSAKAKNKPGENGAIILTYLG
ncbi:MAG: hypothetical protein ACLUGA_07445 [Oscillospiraceae bacterium]